MRKIKVGDCFLCRRGQNRELIGEIEEEKFFHHFYRDTVFKVSSIRSSYVEDGYNILDMECIQELEYLGREENGFWTRFLTGEKRKRIEPSNIK